MLDVEITAAQFETMRHTDGNTVLLDVREPWEISTASIPGSLNIAMGDLPAQAHAALDPDQPVIVVCHHGMRSLSVPMWLRREGFDKAQSLAGGIDQYSREINPGIPRY